MEFLKPEILANSVSTLKNIPRTGWLQCGVPLCEAETVAEHTFEVASILAIFSFVMEKKVDKEKMLVMGIIHDLAESEIGDIPRSLADRIGGEVKRKTEMEIIKSLSNSSGLRRLNEVFEEYERRDSQEALLVKAADLLSTIRQATIYSKRGIDVSEIIKSYKDELSRLLRKLDDKNIDAIVDALS